MPSDELAAVASAYGWTFDGRSLDVPLYGDRAQRVRVDPMPDGTIRVWSLAASANAVSGMDRPELLIMLQNRLSEVIKHGVDGRGRWVVEATFHSTDSQPELLTWYVRQVARSGDRIEALTTGVDRY